jgi:hypothetical protein
VRRPDADGESRFGAEQPVQRLVVEDWLGIGRRQQQREEHYRDHENRALFYRLLPGVAIIPLRGVPADGADVQPQMNADIQPQMNADNTDKTLESCCRVPSRGSSDGRLGGSSFARGLSNRRGRLI